MGSGGGGYKCGREGAFVNERQIRGGKRALLQIRGMDGGSGGDGGR